MLLFHRVFQPIILLTVIAELAYRVCVERSKTVIFKYTMTLVKVQYLV